MKGTIHRASLTEADLHHEGAIAIDRKLLDAAGIAINERVDIFNAETGARFGTYAIEAPEGSGTVALNGAAARLAIPGDTLIIVAYASFNESEARRFNPRVVRVDRENRILPA